MLAFTSGQFIFFFFLSVLPVQLGGLTSPVFLLLQRTCPVAHNAPIFHSEIRSVSTALQQHLMVIKHIADIIVAHPLCLFQSSSEVKVRVRWKDRCNMDNPYGFILLLKNLFPSVS